MATEIDVKNSITALLNMSTLKNKGDFQYNLLVPALLLLLAEVVETNGGIIS